MRTVIVLDCTINDLGHRNGILRSHLLRDPMSAATDPDTTTIWLLCWHIGSFLAGKRIREF